MSSIKEQIIDALCDTEGVHVTREVVEFIENLPVKEPEVENIAVTTAVMTHNCFVDLYDFYTNKGVMDVCDILATWLRNFALSGPTPKWKSGKHF